MREHDPESQVTCGMCRELFHILAIGTHIKVMHPGIERATGELELWPDGGIVAFEDLSPEQFGPAG